jgi:predicted transposase YbfD/YdcC
LVFGQVKTGEKNNEITAIPTLLELIALKGGIVTIDAADFSPRDGSIK